MNEGSQQNVAAFLGVAFGFFQLGFPPLCYVAIILGVWGLIEASEIGEGWIMSFFAIGLGFVGIHVIGELMT